MSVQAQIDGYIAGLEPPKREAIQTLHKLMLRLSPDCRFWFLDGRDSQGKVVTNENIGYGTQTLKYAGGGSKEFYRVGLSANTSGISIYLMGLADRTFLSETYGERIGKAKITGYCVSFRKLGDVSLETIEEMFAAHMAEASADDS